MRAYAGNTARLTGAIISLDGITANVVAPGFTETEMVAAIPGDVLQQILGRIPLRRLAHPEEVAKAVAFLVCDGDYITGQQINVNGGIYM